MEIITVLLLGGGVIWLLSKAGGPAISQAPTGDVTAIRAGIPIPTHLEGKPVVRGVSATSGNVYEVTTWPEQSDGKGLYNFAMLKAVPGAWISWRTIPAESDKGNALVSLFVPDGFGDELAAQMMKDFFVVGSPKKAEVA